MNYMVRWRPSAENELAEIWMTATDRAAVTRAVNEADLVLRRDPLAVGESRSGAARVVFIAPLVLTYEILHADRVVSVLS